MLTMKRMCILICLCSGSWNCDADAILLNAVQTHVDLILKHGKDRWGPTQTELFVDGLHVDDFRPTLWQEKQRSRKISNLASQQVWLRTLSALSAVSGEERYQDQAEATMTDAFRRLRTPEGLLYWGGHLAYDLERDQPWGMWNHGHELKQHYPWFSALYEVDADATTELMEAIWIRHMGDWESLLFNRHGEVSKPSKSAIRLQPQPGWAYPYQKDIELPLRPEGSELSFVVTAASLIHTGLTHARLTAEPELALWSLRLADRYWSLRDPETGLGGYQFNVRNQPDSGDKAQKQYESVLGSRAREWLLLSPLSARQIDFPLMLLLHADALPDGNDVKQKLIDETVSEWLSYVRYAYQAEQKHWIAISTDGMPLPVAKMTQKGYYSQRKWKPKASNGKDLQLAALAYRLRPGKETLQALNDLLAAVGITYSESDAGLISAEEGTRNAAVIFALLDVERSLPRVGALSLAEELCLEMLETHRVNGLFVPDTERIWASINTPLPLAILHVLAAQQESPPLLASPLPDSGFFHAPFHGVASKNWGRTYDRHVFYQRTRAEPSSSQDPSEGR